MNRKRVAVIGAGISGLATAWRVKDGARARGLDVDVVVLERDERTGGKIHTRSADGFRVEAGPNGFLDSKPDTVTLAQDLGLGDELLASSDAARRRYVFRHGKLHALPESPPRFLRSQLMSLRGRLRILAEPFISPAPPELDESLADFGRRRLGAEAVEALLDPMVTGILAGDPAQLSVSACFPRIKELERDHGSLIRAMIHLQREKRRALAATAGQDAAAPVAGPSGPGGRLTSFAPGMSRLTGALTEALGDGVRVGVDVSSLDRLPDGRYRVLFEHGTEALTVDRVVLACPAFAAGRIVARVASAAPRVLDAIPYAAVSVVALAWPRAAVPHSLDGFGFLIPHAEGRRILGSLWTSSIFPGVRAPDGQVLIRALVGGARNGDLAALPDDELVATVTGELGAMLGISEPPGFQRIVRWPRAIPQYTVGHRERLRRVEQALAPAPGVWLTGNAYRGVGINDCTREAARVADELLDSLAAPSKP